MTVYEKLLTVQKTKGAGYLVLLDPDKQDMEQTLKRAVLCAENGVDALLIGGSLLFCVDFDKLIQETRRRVSIPVIIFPGSTRQISKFADAILFLSLISGRNPNNLIGEQVLAAPIIKALGIEPISTGYMLIESGGPTSTEFISNTRPIPRNKSDIALAHTLAAEYLGMKLAYLEAGSGAVKSVPEEMICAVAKRVSIPLVVGGGIQTPEEAQKKVQAGASFVVTGNVLEWKGSGSLIREFAEAIHKENRQMSDINSKP